MIAVEPFDPLRELLGELVQHQGPAVTGRLALSSRPQQLFFGRDRNGGPERAKDSPLKAWYPRARACVALRGVQVGRIGCDLARDDPVGLAFADARREVHCQEANEIRDAALRDRDEGRAFGRASGSSVPNEMLSVPSRNGDGPPPLLTNRFSSSRPVSTSRETGRSSCGVLR
jgi:hypothetical protein